MFAGLSPRDANQKSADDQTVIQKNEILPGDFFQVIPISNSQASVIVCDVMGHGVRASMVTAVLRGLAAGGPQPDYFTERVSMRWIALSVTTRLDTTMIRTEATGCKKPMAARAIPTVL